MKVDEQKWHRVSQYDLHNLKQGELLKFECIGDKRTIPEASEGDVTIAGVSRKGGVVVSKGEEWVGTVLQTESAGAVVGLFTNGTDMARFNLPFSCVELNTIVISKFVDSNS